MDDLMTDRERAILGRVWTAAEKAHDVLERALQGVKVTDEPASVYGDAVDALLALGALCRSCGHVSARDAALAEVQ